MIVSILLKKVIMCLILVNELIIRIIIWGDVKLEYTKDNPKLMSFEIYSAYSIVV